MGTKRTEPLSRQNRKEGDNQGEFRLTAIRAANEQTLETSPRQLTVKRIRAYAEKITVPCDDASAQRPKDKLGDPVVGTVLERSDPVVPKSPNETLTSQIHPSNVANSRQWPQPKPNLLRRRSRMQHM